MSERNDDARALLAESLWTHPNPEISTKFKNLIAEAHPNAKSQMPDVVVREEGAKLLAAGQKMIDDFRKEQDATKVARERESWQSRLTKGFKGPDGATHRIDADDIEGVEKFMVENAVASPEVAAFAYLTQKRVAAPSSAWEPPGVRIPGQAGTGDFFKGIMENPDQWGRERAHTIWNDLKNGRGQQWLDN